MATLIETGPLPDIHPQTYGAVTLSPGAPRPLHSVAPLAGKARALAAALKSLGLAQPGPGGWLLAPDARGHLGAQIFWSGRETAMLAGVAPSPALLKAAAVTDQTDGWAAIDIQGRAAAAVLARLCPLDLRAQAFAPGQVARAPLGHMMAIHLRSTPDAFRVMVFRSMARTAWHELEVAARAVALRG